MYIGHIALHCTVQLTQSWKQIVENIGCANSFPSLFGPISNRRGAGAKNQKCQNL